MHSLHNRDVRTSTTPPPADESGVADPFPTGARVEVWWPGDKCYYTATVLTSRTASHSIKRVKTLCREIYCDYILDSHTQWHSLHNNIVRLALDKGAQRPTHIAPPPQVPIRVATDETG